jgi:hypothetical protein
MFIGNESPQMFFTHLHSLSIVLWEVLARLLNKKYCSPYEEYGFRFDWQILVAISQNNQRPTFPESTPPSIKKTIQQAMYKNFNMYISFNLFIRDTNPTNRPHVEELLNTYFQIYEEYKNNKEEWKQLTGE